LKDLCCTVDMAEAFNHVGDNTLQR
jgi:hypothetical protein